jgi:cytochrome c peroxidase
MNRLPQSLILLLLLTLGWCYQASAAPAKDEELIRKGRDLFINGTFGGNNRTCATCHPEENNFTLDPKFIATLPDDDPLFVHEFDPQLAELEDAVLLRKFGLFLENVDGFDQPPVFRSVPHTLGLRTSIEHNDPRLTALGKGHALGWSGDGSADAGFIGDFVTGAIIQHYPKTLNRIEGEDFILPTQEEKDAIEAFMLSLGRQKEINLEDMNFKSPLVNLGKDLFFSPASGPCNTCHDNAGANSFLAGGKGLNFAIGVEDLPSAPHKLENPEIARDAGLGSDFNPSGGLGDDSFNSPPLVEAADTPPFFHNNAVNNIESAVAFYTSDAFRNSPAAQALGSDVQLETTEVVAIAALLRTINALENIRSSMAVDQKAKTYDIQRGREKLYPALFDSEDAYQVLDGMEYNLFENAFELLREAHSQELSAYEADDVNHRNQYLNKAIYLKRKARKQMVH